MSIEWKLLGVIIAVLAFASTGCSAICSACANSDSGNVAPNSASQGPTVEIRGRSPEVKDYVSKSVVIHVGRGNVYVAVVKPADANHVVFVARGVLLTDNQAEIGFIKDKDKTVFNPDGTVMVEFTPGDDVPALDVHVYVPQDVPVKIDADNGDIRVSGNTGAVTARANGSIEVRDATRDLNLTAQGEKHGITVDSAHNQLVLHADNGPIEILANDVNVNASTGTGDILSVGQLLSGTTNYFTTTTGSNITVVMPRYDVYEFAANTTANTIDVQFPATADGKSSPVCGTFDADSTIVFNTAHHQDRGQATFSKDAGGSGGLATLTGLVTQRYFAFHSTAHNVLLEIPSASEFFIGTLLAENSGSPPTAAGLPVTTSMPSPPPVTQADRDLIARFTGTPVAEAVETPVAQAGAALPLATSGNWMYPTRCTVPGSERPLPRVKIFATSNGGNIRIYQNLP